MNSTTMSCRHFLCNAALGVAAAPLGRAAFAAERKVSTPAGIKPGTNTSFASLKQIDAGRLNVGYAEAGF